MRVAVIVASMGRPREIEQFVQAMQRQTRRPATIVISVTGSADLPDGLPEPIKVIVGPAGACAQRNRALDAVTDRCDVVVFFDDDFVPTRTALADIAGLFEDEPDIVGVTGLVLADGVKTGGIPHQAALETIAAVEATPPESRKFWPRAGLYGCNMAFRASAIGETRFDENLALHGWQEDIDFAARLRTKGRIVKTNAFAGVHLGVKNGRSAGLAVGFSQVVNPIYLVRKGTMPTPMAAKLVIRNVLANHIKAIRPEPFIDRLGRVKGNWLGFAEVIRGRVDPAAIIRLKKGNRAGRQHRAVSEPGRR